MKKEQSCECTDPGCTGAHDAVGCTQKATCIVRRIDMDDGESRFAFCLECTNDAMDSGVFAFEGKMPRCA